jgi:hypothetical protein
MHSKIVISCGALIVAMVARSGAAPSAAEPNAALQGVWRTLEVVVPGAAGRTFKPEATLTIFYGRHYSRVEVHAEQPLESQQILRRTLLRVISDLLLALQLGAPQQLRVDRDDDRAGRHQDRSKRRREQNPS